MHTVVELPEYLRRAERLLSERERQELVDYLAERPKAGVIMRGTRGIRKLRWARTGMGKRGGVRVIYYYHNEQIPLYLLTVFGKGAKDDLNPSERRALRDLVRTLIETWRRSHE
jgi:mRNA-degrading endonuclease RelE of RelBE toxin-antitoxin system